MMKLYLSINDADKFIQGDYNWCFRVHSEEALASRLDSYTLVGSFEIDISNSKDDVIKKAVAECDRKEKELRVWFQSELNKIMDRKNNLLALEHIPG